jgi:hypothetical protein
MIKLRSGINIMEKAALKSNTESGNRSITKGCNKYIPKVALATLVAFIGKICFDFDKFLINTNIVVATIKEGTENGVFIIYEGSPLLMLL